MYEHPSELSGQLTITYTYKKGLYLNITNRCTNACEFCIRDNDVGVYGSSPLILEREPSVDEIIDDLSKRNLADFDEIIFCGYGEPTCRLDDMLVICRHLREVCALPIRLNTNGHASMIAGKDTAPMFDGMFDAVSISLNAANAATYLQVCRPEFGISAYDGMLDFAVKLTKFVPKVAFSVVGGTVPDEQIAVCERIAAEIGIEFRLRVRE